MIICKCFILLGDFSGKSLVWVEVWMCSYLCFVVSYWNSCIGIEGNDIVFSLEDEDYGNLFITQESNVGYNSKELCEKEELGESSMLFGVDRKDFLEHHVFHS